MRRSPAHSERCAACKTALKALLDQAFGEVVVGPRFGWPTRPRDYAASPLAAELQRIHDVLVAERGHTNFVGRARIPASDFFVRSLALLVELDESQHFTTPRASALAAYPRSVRLGFDRDEWLTHCRVLHVRDSDPHRDETRAWYDTLRDLVPSLHGMAPTVRLRAGSVAFCEMSPARPEDIEQIRALVAPWRQPEPQEERAMDWSVVKARHVESAIAAYGDGPPGSRAGRTTFLLSGERRLAAKYVRGLAYEKATGRALASTAYGGGMETVHFFLRLGYTVQHDGRRHEPRAPSRTDRAAAARVAGISIEGVPWPAGRALRDRCAFLEDLPAHLPRGMQLEAIQLPGGFLTFEGKLPAGFQQRKAFLERARHAFAKSCMDAARLLDRHSPGAALCVGIDSPDARDQLNVAWRPSGIVAMARKIFPTKDEGTDLVCDVDDFATAHRYLELPSGRTALLCACYDVYGCADHGPRGTRARCIRNLSSKGKLLTRRDPTFSEELHDSLAGFSEQLLSRWPRVVLAAIHQTRGRHTYWHKHGLPDASAILDGALVVGGVHFRGIPLPRDLSRHPYAASGVPRKRLDPRKDFRKRPVVAARPVRTVPLEHVDETRARIAFFESPRAD
jgi:hypothetical protein